MMRRRSSPIITPELGAYYCYGTWERVKLRSSAARDPKTVPVFVCLIVKSRDIGTHSIHFRSARDILYFAEQTAIAISILYVCSSVGCTAASPFCAAAISRAYGSTSVSLELSRQDLLLGQQGPTPHMCALSSPAGERTTTRTCKTPSRSRKSGLTLDIPCRGIRAVGFEDLEDNE